MVFNNLKHLFWVIPVDLPLLYEQTGWITYLQFAVILENWR